MRRDESEAMNSVSMDTSLQDNSFDSENDN